MGRGSDHHLEGHSQAASECATSISSSVMGDDCGSNSSRRGSDDTQPDHKRERSDHRGPLRFFKRKESRYKALLAKVGTPYLSSCYIVVPHF